MILCVHSTTADNDANGCNSDNKDFTYYNSNIFILILSLNINILNTL